MFCIFFVLSTQTLLLHPRARKDILSKAYTKYPDLLLKKAENKNLVIALHGMYSHTGTFQEFGEKILPLGWDLFAPVLPNSSQNSKDLQDQEIYQWEESLRVAFHKIVLNCEAYEKIVLMGHSQGGALALTLAPSLGFIDGLAVVAAPLHMTNPKNSFWKKLSIPLTGFLHFIIPGHGAKVSSSQYEDIADVEDIIGAEGYFYGLTIHSMILGLRKTRKRLDRIIQPLFLGYEKNDKTVSFQDYLEIKAKVKSPKIVECISETPEERHPSSQKHRLFSYKPVKDKLHQDLILFLKELL